MATLKRASLRLDRRVDPLADELQRRCFDDLDQPVVRVHGGEAAPSVSKVLERAADVGLDAVKAGYAQMMADLGRPIA